MSTAKTRVDTGVAQEFLEQRFSAGPVDVRKIKGGELAEAFFFEVEGSEYVLRVHSKSSGFIKDRYAFERFASSQIPIPEIIMSGRFDSGHLYAISDKASGVTQDELSVERRRAVIPSVLR